MTGIHRWPMDSPHKGQWRGALMFFVYLRLTKRLNKQSRCRRRRWIGTHGAHYDVTTMNMMEVVDNTAGIVSGAARLYKCIINNLNQQSPAKCIMMKKQLNCPYIDLVILFTMKYFLKKTVSSWSYLILSVSWKARLQVSYKFLFVDNWT